MCKSLLKYYIKLFLVFGVASSVLMAIGFSFRFGITYGIAAGLMAGVLYGVFMALIIGTIHQLSARRASGEGFKNILGVHHIRKVELNLPFDKTYDLCIGSLCAIGKNEIRIADPYKGLIKVKTRANPKTFGDIVSFKLRQVGLEVTEVEVSSRPYLRTTIADYGKNLDNVRKIINYLKANCVTVDNE